jgi:hypothetical protein
VKEARRIGGGGAAHVEHSPQNIMGGWNASVIEQDSDDDESLLDVRVLYLGFGRRR